MNALSRRLSTNFPMDLIALTVGIGALMAAYGGFRAFYFEGQFLGAISYVSDEHVFNEIVNGWIGRDPASTLFGIHAFGDYLLPSIWATIPDPWTNQEVTYLPPVIALFKGLNWLPASGGLVVMESVIVLAATLPMVVATRRLPWSTRILAMTVLGVLAGPTLAALDRGNVQGVMPLLLFGFALAVLRERWGWASVLLALAIVVKIYPVVLVLVLLARRQWKWGGIAIGEAALLVVGGLLITTGDPIGSIPSMVNDVLGFQGKAFADFMPYNASLAGGLAHASQFVGLHGLAAWIAAHALVVGLGYALVVVPLLWSDTIELWVRLILGFMLTTALMPLVYPYALNWVVAAAALAVMMSARDANGPRVDRRTEGAVLVSLALVASVYPVFIPGSMEAGIPAGVQTLAAAGAVLILPGVLWVNRARGRRVALSA